VGAIPEISVSIAASGFGGLLPAAADDLRSSRESYLLPYSVKASRL
jgi:hypothetical protein